MADILKTKTHLLAQFQVGVIGGITAQNMRDLVTTTQGGHGSISFDGSVNQLAITTTPVILTAFDTNNQADGITTDHANDKLVTNVSGTGDVVWRVYSYINFSDGTNIKWTFELYKNSIATGIQFGNKMGSAGDVAFSLGEREVIGNDTDKFELFVNSDVGGGTTLTTLHAALGLKLIG